MLALSAPSLDLLHLVLTVVAIVLAIVARALKKNHVQAAALVETVVEVMGGHPDGQALLRDARAVANDRGHAEGFDTVVSAVLGESAPPAPPSSSNPIPKKD